MFCSIFILGYMGRGHCWETDVFIGEELSLLLSVLFWEGGGFLKYIIAPEGTSAVRFLSTKQIKYFTGSRTHRITLIGWKLLGIDRQFRHQTAFSWESEKNLRLKWQNWWPRCAVCHKWLVRQRSSRLKSCWQYTSKALNGTPEITDWWFWLSSYQGW